MCGGAGLALPMLARMKWDGDEDDYYCGVDMDSLVCDLARQRLGKYILLAEHHRAENTGSLLYIKALQSLASTPTSLILPKHNIPATKDDGSALSLNPMNNLECQTGASECAFEIKTSDKTGENGLPLGEGLFLRQDANPIEAGTYIPAVQFYGTFVLTAQLENLYPEHCPTPGVFELSHPLEQYSMEISSKCPGGKINDARGTLYTNTPTHISHRAPHRIAGTGCEVNVIIVQDEYPATLAQTGNFQHLLFLQAKRTIQKGEELLCDYGPKFWASNKIDDAGTHFYNKQAPCIHT
jgi:hypothetical protein